MCIHVHIFKKSIIQIFNINFFPNRPKHPTKVHVWAGISLRGRTGICIFEGIMNAELFIDILDKTLLPFIDSVYPEGHKFMQDNDPKHSSNMTKQWLEDKSVNWWKTPAESPDLNPIENLWYELKEYIRREIKPKSKQNLLTGYKSFGGLWIKQSVGSTLGTCEK